MSIWAICVSLAVGILFWWAERNFYNPGTLMGFLWAIICYMANLRAYELFVASDFTYFLITLGLAFFGLGCFFSRQWTVKISRGNIPRLLNKSEDATFSYMLIRILCILSVFVMLGNAINSVKLLLSGVDMADIRAQDEMYSYNNVLLRLLNNYIVRPFSFAILPIFAADFFGSKKYDKITLICTFFIIIERVLIEGGRVIIIYVLCALLVSLSAMKRHIKVPMKRVWFLIGLTVVSAIAIYFVTISRGIESEGQARSLYKYICGCVPHLSIRLEAMENLKIYTWGFSSMNGIVHYVLSLFENIGMEYPEFFQTVRELINVEDKVYISGDYDQFNAFVSPIYYMYLDGRIWGVVLGMFLYGFFSFKCYVKIKDHIYPRDLAVYLLIVQGLMTTMVRIQFSQVHYTVAFFFICFLINRKQTENSEIVEDAGIKSMPQNHGRE